MEVVVVVVAVGAVVVVVAPHAADPDADRVEVHLVLVHDDHNPLPRYLGPHLDPLNKPHHEGHLEPWTKRIYNVDYVCCYKTKNNAICPRTRDCQHHQDQ